LVEQTTTGQIEAMPQVRFTMSDNTIPEDRSGVTNWPLW